MQTEELRNELKKVIEKADRRLLRILYASAREYLRNEKAKNNQLYRLVYTSARSENYTEECVKQILESSRKNNPSKNITGLLVHTDSRFLQILEGPHDKVMETYKSIEKDNRHGGSIMRFCEPVDERYFGDWHMAFKDVSENIGFDTNLSEKERLLYKSMMDGDLNSYKDEGMRVLKTFLAVS
jgi:hypothetical protein